MKIFKKPIILPCECKVCGAVFQPKYRNPEMCHSRFTKDLVTCPICKASNVVKFDKRSDTNDR